MNLANYPSKLQRVLHNQHPLHSKQEILDVVSHIAKWLTMM
jgi:hypothetical protein